MTNVNESATDTEVPATAAAAVEKPVDPAVIAAAEKRRATEIARLAASDALRVVLRDWSQKDGAAADASFAANKKTPDDPDGPAQAAAVTANATADAAADAVAAAALAFMKAKGDTDLNDGPADVTQLIRRFRVGNAKKLQAAADAAMAAIAPVTVRKFSTGLPPGSVTAATATPAPNAGDSSDESGSVADVGFSPERIAPDPMNPPIHNAETLRTESAFFH